MHAHHIHTICSPPGTVRDEIEGEGKRIRRIRKDNGTLKRPIGIRERAEECW